MRHRGRVLLAFAGSISAVATASGQSLPWYSGQSLPWYIEGSVGAIWRTDLSYSTTIFNSTGLRGPGTNTDVFSPGPVLNLGIGYKLPYGFRAEVEGGYAHYGLANVSPLSTNGLFPAINGNRLNLVSGGARDQYSATLNVFYDLPAFGRVVPYVGGGAGAQYLNAQTGIFTGPGSLQFTQLGSHATDAVVLAEGGLSFNVKPNWSIVPSYRFEAALPTSGPGLYAHIFKLGARYSPTSVAATPVLVHK